MLAVVPGEERLTEDAGVLDASEAFRELRAILLRFKLGLGEGIIVAGVRLAVHFGIHRSASGHATGLDVMEEPRSACEVNCHAPICSFSQVVVLP
jgi:hypothetical protein